MVPVITAVCACVRRGYTPKFSCLPEHGNIERRHAVGFDVVDLESVATVDVTHLVDVRLAALDHDVKEAANGRHQLALAQVALRRCVVVVVDAFRYVLQRDDACVVRTAKRRPIAERVCRRSAHVGHLQRASDAATETCRQC